MSPRLPTLAMADFFSRVEGPEAPKSSSPQQVYRLHRRRETTQSARKPPPMLPR